MTWDERWWLTYWATHVPLPWCFLKGTQHPTGLRITWRPCLYCRPLGPSRLTESESLLVGPGLGIFVKTRFWRVCLVSRDSSLSATWFILLTNIRLIFQSVTLITSFPCHLKMGYHCLAGFLFQIPGLQTFSNLASTYFLVMSPITHIATCTAPQLASARLDPLRTSYTQPRFLPPSCLCTIFMQLGPATLGTSSLLLGKFSSLAPSSEASSPMIASYPEVRLLSSHNQ